MKTLAVWLSANDVTASEFADWLGVHRSTVGRWIDGTGKPSWEQIPRIYELTKGEVTANAFAELSEAAIPPPESDAA